MHPLPLDEVLWDDMHPCVPLIVTDSDTDYLVFFNPMSVRRGLVLPTGAYWDRYVTCIDHPPKVTQLTLRVGHNQQLVYYANNRHRVGPDHTIIHKQIDGEHFGLPEESQDIMRAMHCTYIIHGSNLIQR